jgi:hypothetical protein
MREDTDRDLSHLKTTPSNEVTGHNSPLSRPHLPSHQSKPKSPFHQELQHF